MRKSTLFISTMLTVFTVATLLGVVSAYAYQGTTTEDQSEPAVKIQPVSRMDFPSRLMSVAPTQTGVVTPEQATTFAMQMIGRTDVYSVESTTYEGAAAYLITFTSGDLVYVSPAGQILAVTQLEPVVIVRPRGNNDNNDTQGGAPSGGGGEHDDHEDEDHEEHEGDD
jgi:hypothetical protein